MFAGPLCDSVWPSHYVSSCLHGHTTAQTVRPPQLQCDPPPSHLSQFWNKGGVIKMGWKSGFLHAASVQLERQSWGEKKTAAMFMIGDTETLRASGSLCSCCWKKASRLSWRISCSAAELMHVSSLRGYSDSTFPFSSRDPSARSFGLTLKKA